MRTASNILKILEGIESRDMHTKLSDFFKISAIAIRNQVESHDRDAWEKRYMDIVSGYKPEHLQLFSKAFAEMYREYQGMLDGNREWTDLAGETYMESATSNDKSGQFFTPYCISLACAENDITEEGVKAKLADDPDEVITLLEPSCGAGGMVIAAAEVLQKHHVNYSWNMFADCTDVDERCVCMAYIQLSLLGIPAVIHHGNSLTLEEWSRWYTPAYIFNCMHFRGRIDRKKSERPTEISRAQKQPPPIPEERPKAPPQPIVQQTKIIEPVQLSLF